MNNSAKNTEPQLKDMSIEDAKAFIDSGWKALPALEEHAHHAVIAGTYEAMLTIAKMQPALVPDFVRRATSFIESRPLWANKIVPTLFEIGRAFPNLACPALDAG